MLSPGKIETGHTQHQNNSCTTRGGRQNWVEASDGGSHPLTCEWVFYWKKNQVFGFRVNAHRRQQAGRERMKNRFHEWRRWHTNLITAHLSYSAARLFWKLQEIEMELKNQYLPCSFYKTARWIYQKHSRDINLLDQLFPSLTGQKQKESEEPFWLDNSPSPTKILAIGTWN